MNKSYFSNASWTKIDDTQDEHSLHDSPEENLEYARGICRRLKANYGSRARACETRGVYTKVWITDSSGNVIE